MEIDQYSYAYSLFEYPKYYCLSISVFYILHWTFLKKCKTMFLKINIPVTFKYKKHQLTTDIVKINKFGLG